MEINELKNILKEKGTDDKAIEEFITFLTPFYNFRDYLSNKLNITLEDIDILTEKYITDNISNIKNEYDSQVKNYIYGVAELYSDYAKQEGFTEYAFSFSANLA